jgi:hypothetical protein
LRQSLHWKTPNLPRTKKKREWVICKWRQ